MFPDLLQGNLPKLRNCFFLPLHLSLKKLYYEPSKEALESVMYDVIKIRLKRRDATRSKIKLKIFLKFGNPSLQIGCSTAVWIISGWFPFSLLVAVLVFRHILMMTSHMTFSSASEVGLKGILHTKPSQFNFILANLKTWLTRKDAYFNNTTTTS